jgi:CRISPR-associated protein Cas2
VTTIIVTRNVKPRVRGFLASTAVEVAPGVYCGARVSRSVRERIWVVLTEWFTSEKDTSIVMIWTDSSTISGLEIRALGAPPIQLTELVGLIVAKRSMENHSSQRFRRSAT